MQALALDGMAQVLYPEYNVIDAARPLLTGKKTAVPSPCDRHRPPTSPPSLADGAAVARRRRRRGRHRL